MSKLRAALFGRHTRVPILFFLNRGSSPKKG